MHEMALMGDILQLIEEDIKKHNMTKVDAIDLIVGQMSNALPDALQMAFDVYKAQNIPFLHEKSELHILEEKAKAVCVICGEEYEPDQAIAICPSCHIPSGKLISGETFRVESYEGS